MKSDDFTAGLANHLRRQGVAFNRADLEAFAADVCREPGIDPDVAEMARRFWEACVEDVWEKLTKKRVRALGDAVIAAISGVLLLVAPALSGLTRFAAPAPGPEVVRAEIAAGFIVAFLGLCLVIAALVNFYRVRKLAVEIKRLQSRDATP